MYLNIPFLPVVLLLSLGCLQSNQIRTSMDQENKNMEVLRKLYKEYRKGQISACILHNKPVFTATFSAVDAPVYIYDSAGLKIGTCNYAWGRYDAICRELKNCEVIYRVKDNIWQMPAVDKYGLAGKD